MAGRIFVTGDLHGGHDIRKLASNSFNKNNELGLTKNDYLIVTGDFGLLWYKEGSEYDKRDRYWLDWLEEKPWTTLFVDGNHENFPRLNSYQIMQWNGGKIHEIRESIIHLMRGQVFKLHGKKFFTMGGAYSHDIEYRTEGKSWWREEVPSFCEREEALINLAAHDWKVDYVITHDAPTIIANRLIYTPDRSVDDFTDWLEEVANKLEFNQWFFGHHHQDRELFDGKFQAMYYDVAQII